MDDPGDGSLILQGCPDGFDWLGMIDDGAADADAGTLAAGGLCCACLAQNTGCPRAAVACGAQAGNSCASGEYCASPQGLGCDSGDPKATCLTRPLTCTGLKQQVCGCNGITYDNACAANAAGMGVATIGGCLPSKD
jgi:hypothetical protein